jgi:hypothetical protein
VESVLDSLTTSTKLVYYSQVSPYFLLLFYTILSRGVGVCRYVDIIITVHSYGLVVVW